MHMLNSLDLTVDADVGLELNKYNKHLKPFTTDDAKPKIVKLQITNRRKPNNKQHHSKVLLDSFAMNGHTPGAHGIYS